MKPPPLIQKIWNPRLWFRKKDYHQVGPLPISVTLTPPEQQSLLQNKRELNAYAQREFGRWQDVPVPGRSRGLRCIPTWRTMTHQIDATAWIPS